MYTTPAAMLPPARYLQVAAFVLAGFGLGWSAARFGSSPVLDPPSLGSTAKASLRVEPVGSSGESTTGQNSFSSGFKGYDNTPVTKPADLEGAFRSASAIVDPMDKALRIREIIRTLSADDIPDALEKARRLPYYDQYELLNALGTRWAELDVNGALAFASKAANSGLVGQYNSFLHGVVQKWSASAPDAAIAWVVAQPPGQQRSQLAGTLLESFGRVNPNAVLQLLKSNPGITQGPWVLQSVFSSWAGRDPESAAAGALELKGDNQSAALRGIASSMAQQDGAAAMNWATGIANPLTRKQAIQAVASQWSESDPLAVVRWSSGLKDDEQRQQVLGDALSGLAGRDLPAALSEIRKLPEGEQRDRVLMRVADTLCNTDARTAISLLSDIPASPEKARALAGLCSVWGNSDPRAALEWLFQNSKPAKGDYGVANTLGKWVRQSPDEALTWAQSLGSGENRETAMAAISSGLAYSDLPKAQQLFKTLSAESQAAVAQNLAASMASEDMAAARTWAESLPPGRAQNTALGTIAGRLARQDSTAAAQWIERLPSGPGRDQAISSFASYALNRDPEGAVTWALTISDESDRSRKVEDLSRQWMNTDSTSARAWIQNSSQLTAEQKKRLLRR